MLHTNTRRREEKVGREINCDWVTKDLKFCVKVFELYAAGNGRAEVLGRKMKLSDLIWVKNIKFQE